MPIPKKLKGMTAVNSVISCKGLEKRYGAKRALKGIDLEVETGSIVALLGTNGAGKTTLIRTLLGLIPKSRGEIRVLGEEPYKFGAQLRQRIGYVSEEQGLYGWMSVREIIRFCQSLYPVWDQELIAKYLERFKISPKTKIETLSKGQQVKLALLLALAPKPELLILDEPMSGLDPFAQHEFLQVIMKEIRQEGRTIFFSTHNLADAMTVAKQVAIVYDGRIQAFGSISEVCSKVVKLRGTPAPDQPLTGGFAGGVLLAEEPDSTTWLVPAQGLAEIAAGSELADSAAEPATLEEAFLFFCAGREEA